MLQRLRSVFPDPARVPLFKCYLNMLKSEIRQLAGKYQDGKAYRAINKETSLKELSESQGFNIKPADANQII